MSPAPIFSFLRIIKYTTQLSEADVEESIKKAFQVWSNASPLTFTKTSQGEADIKITFVQGGRLVVLRLALLANLGPCRG